MSGFFPHKDTPSWSWSSRWGTFPHRGPTGGSLPLGRALQVWMCIYMYVHGPRRVTHEYIYIWYMSMGHAPYRCECIINTQAVWPMYMPWAQSSVIWRVDMYSKRVPERNPKISLKNTKNFPAVKKATDGCLSKKLAVVMNLCYYYHTINGWGKKSKFLIVIN